MVDFKKLVKTKFVKMALYAAVSALASQAYSDAVSRQPDVVRAVEAALGTGLLAMLDKYLKLKLEFKKGKQG